MIFFKKKESVWTNDCCLAKQDQAENMQGCMGLLQIQGEGMSRKKLAKMQLRIDRIEKAILSFFQDLKDRLESIDGLDLTDRGDEVVGAGLCMMLPSSAENSSSGSSDDDEDDADFATNTEEEEDDDEGSSSSSSSSGSCEEEEEDEDESAAAVGSKRKI
jgi:hypothetical protein